MGSPKNADGSLLQRLPLIFCAASVSETSLYPLDLVKTRMQFADTKIGWISTTRQVVKTEGLGIFAGIQPAILRHFIYSTTRIFTYEQLRSSWRERNGDVEPSIMVKLAIGSFTGGFGQFIASPTDLLKIRMQTDRQRHNPPIYKGVRHCAQCAYNEGGVIGMWRGVGPNVYRAMAVNFGELAIYDIAKRKVMAFTGFPDGVTVHSMAAVISGLTSTLCSCPFDVVKTRLMAGSHTGIWRCFRDTVSVEGASALYKGFLPTWARLGPWQFIFWVTYERLRYYAGIEGF